MYLFIHRKDLRIEDMTAFTYMAEHEKPSMHILILDPFILKRDRHVELSGVNFMMHVNRLRQLYRRENKQLHIVYGEPITVLAAILDTHPISEIVYHRDFTPYARLRDQDIYGLAIQRSIPIHAPIDHTLADLQEFQDSTGRPGPYRVFTPFYRKWTAYIQSRFTPPSEATLDGLAEEPLHETITARFVPPFQLEDYAISNEPQSDLAAFMDTYLLHYSKGRDLFAEEATSQMSKHTNVGAISIRQLYQAAMDHPIAAEPWTRQLAWRDFYMYQAIYDDEFFLHDRQFDFSLLSDQHFIAWSQGNTGIPIVDAAMRQLNTTGWMPNRLRMVTAMFLTKNLLCPFYLGEKYFRLKLSDYDNILNRGGWLWCASLGFDAAPYFRIMNPATQSKTYDPTGQYIRKWLPELAHLPDKLIHLPQPHAIVNLQASRARAIEVYRQILK